MSPSTASVPPEVETALVGRYNRKVHVLDGLYHLWSANAVEHVKVGAQTRARVVGAVMSCGAVERDGAWSYEWAHRAVPVAAADPGAFVVAALDRANSGRGGTKLAGWWKA